MHTANKYSSRSTETKTPTKKEGERRIHTSEKRREEENIVNQAILGRSRG